MRRQLASWSWRIIDRIDRAIPMVERAVVGLVGPVGSIRRRLLLVALVVAAVVGVISGPTGDSPPGP